MADYTIEKKDGKLIIKKDDKEILGKFKSITPDPEFDGYYIGKLAGRSGAQVLFTRKGNFLHAFGKKEKNVGVSKLIDEILGSENIVESMQSIKSETFWTDENVVRAFRTRHKSRFDELTTNQNSDNVIRERSLFDKEHLCIEKFLAKKNGVTINNVLRESKSKRTETQTTQSPAGNRNNQRSRAVFATNGEGK